MKAKVLMTLLLSVLAAPVTASESFESVFIGPALKVAQMGSEQHRQMRERWERASPEERLEMRRQSQERQRAPEERGQWGVRIPAPSDFAGPANGFSGNFGAGFEQRRPEQEESAPFYDPRNHFNPAGRNRR